MTPRLLDLFAGAGGAARGYQRAGFHVVGVDNRPQPRYAGDEFVQADALEALAEWDLTGFDAVHASPPCQAHSQASNFHGVHDRHPDLIGPTRDLLEESGLPYVIENVVGAPLRRDLVLCGEMFGLRVQRHRVFDHGGWFTMAHPHVRHRLRGATTNCERGDGVARWLTGHYADHGDACDAMGIDWMEPAELVQAIPPAYTELIGHQLVAHVGARAA